jgi:hypothetical protein
VRCNKKINEEGDGNNAAIAFFGSLKPKKKKR